MRYRLAALLPAVILLAGCSGSYDDPLAKPRRQTDPGAFGVAADPFETAPAAAKPTEDQKSENKGAARAAEDKTKVTQEKPKPKPDDVVREEATVGVGEKGSGYGGGIITTPVSVYFRAQERITFNAQIPHSLKLYKAMHGQVPQTLEEFMDEIIKPARMDLPDLPSGYKYVWDPEKEQLMVEHPKK